MEKQYVWYDTAWGCLTALAGLVVASVLAVVTRWYVWRNPWIYYTAGGLGYLGSFYLGGWVDRRVRESRRHQGHD